MGNTFLKYPPHMNSGTMPFAEYVLMRSQMQAAKLPYMRRVLSNGTLEVTQVYGTHYKARWTPLGGASVYYVVRYNNGDETRIRFLGQSLNTLGDVATSAFPSVFVNENAAFLKRFQSYEWYVSGLICVIINSSAFPDDDTPPVTSISNANVVFYNPLTGQIEFAYDLETSFVTGYTVSAFMDSPLATDDDLGMRFFSGQPLYVSVNDNLISFVIDNYIYNFTVTKTDTGYTVTADKVIAQDFEGYTLTKLECENGVIFRHFITYAISGLIDPAQCGILVYDIQTGEITNTVYNVIDELANGSTCSYYGALYRNTYQLTPAISYEFYYIRTACAEDDIWDATVDPDWLDVVSYYAGFDVNLYFETGDDGFLKNQYNVYNISANESSISYVFGHAIQGEREAIAPDSPCPYPTGTYLLNPYYFFPYLYNSFPYDLRFEFKGAPITNTKNSKRLCSYQKAITGETIYITMPQGKYYRNNSYINCTLLDSEGNSSLTSMYLDSDLTYEHYRFPLYLQASWNNLDALGAVNLQWLAGEIPYFDPEPPGFVASPPAEDSGFDFTTEKKMRDLTDIRWTPETLTTEQLYEKLGFSLSSDIIYAVLFLPGLENNPLVSEFLNLRRK